MMKKFITTLSLACMTLAASAEANFMTVELNNGSLISFKLADNPVITYENESLLINKDAKTTYSFEDIKNYHFTETDDTGTPTFSANVLKVVRIDDETIEVQNAQPLSNITLTAVSGVVVAQSKADAEGKATVKLPNNAGVYVLSAGKQSFKIIRKY